MKPQKEIWETLTKKYEEKNQTLQQRELELRYRLEAMQMIIGEGSSNADRTYDDHPAGSPISKINFFSEHGHYQSICVDPTRQMQKDSEVSSCLCPPPSEKSGGFFKCLMSMLSSSKPKSEPPPPPQDIPTKEERQTIITEPVQFNINPVPINPPKVIPLIDDNNNNNNGKCICNTCTLDAADKKSILSKDANGNCNCTGNSDGPTLEARVKSENATPLCSCIDNKLITGTTCVSPMKKPPIPEMPSHGSNLSLKSMDLFYLKNIQELAMQEKALTNMVIDLEKKTKIYQTVLNQYKNEDAMNEAECICKKALEGPDPDEKSSADLKLENLLLKNELNNMRSEVRQYIERMEGPMLLQIESERYKCAQLEQKFEVATKVLVNTQEFYQKEINSLKMELCTANTNMYNISNINQQLTQDFQDLLKKSATLEDDLARQKVSEIETIKRLQDQLDAADAVQNNECDLHELAGQLSKVLKDCEPCGNCMNLPEDLTEASKLLKSLTDMIDGKIAKKDCCDNKITGVRGVEEPEQDIAAKPLNIIVAQEDVPTDSQKMVIAPPVPEVVRDDTTNSVKPISEKVEEPVQPRMDPVEVVPFKEPVLMSAPEKSPKTDEKCCKCSATKEQPVEEKALVPIGASAGVNQVWPCTVCPKVAADSGKECEKMDKCPKPKGKIPLDIDTKEDVVNKVPNGLHITTTITKSGMLEVVTEGPDGLIETTLVYTDSGNVQVVTDITEYGGKGGKALPPLPPPPTNVSQCFEARKQAIKALRESLMVDYNDTEVEGINPDCGCETCPAKFEIETKDSKRSENDSTVREIKAPRDEGLTGRTKSVVIMEPVRSASNMDESPEGSTRENRPESETAITEPNQDGDEGN